MSTSVRCSIPLDRRSIQTQRRHDLSKYTPDEITNVEALLSLSQVAVQRPKSQPSANATLWKVLPEPPTRYNGSHNGSVSGSFQLPPLRQDSNAPVQPDSNDSAAPAALPSIHHLLHSSSSAQAPSSSAEAPTGTLRTSFAEAATVAPAPASPFVTPSLKGDSAMASSMASPISTALEQASTKLNGLSEVRTTAPLLSSVVMPLTQSHLSVRRPVSPPQLSTHVIDLKPDEKTLSDAAAPISQSGTNAEPSRPFASLVLPSDKPSALATFSSVSKETAPATHSTGSEATSESRPFTTTRSEISVLQIQDRPVKHARLHAESRKRRTDKELALLEGVFATNQFPSVELREELAGKIGISEQSVRFWFQNRRAKERRKLKSALRERTPMTVPTFAASPTGTLYVLSPPRSIVQANRNATPINRPIGTMKPILPAMASFQGTSGPHIAPHVFAFAPNAVSTQAPPAETRRLAVSGPPTNAFSATASMTAGSTTSTLRFTNSGSTLMEA